MIQSFRPFLQIHLQKFHHTFGRFKNNHYLCGITQFTTLAPASETGNNIFIPVLQIRLKIVTFASASK